MPADAGIRFGHYVLLRRIARGGMAEVFLAQQRGLEGFDRRVAVKRILPHLADSSEFVKMFLAEAKLAAQLSHPNIVHIYEFGKVEQDYFIAMEYVDGVHAGQLFRHGEGEKLSPTMVARVGADAAAALNHAHELRGTGGNALGLVHRDVSPANIMISYDGVVKLCDFGIAKAAAVSDQLTNPGQVKGKYAYMSPEQTIGAQLDGRSDVFSLAIVLWELLAGRFIVPRGDAVAAMRAIRDGKIEPLAAVAPTAPAPLVAAISWALEKQRDKRATAAELTQALEAYIKSSPELATPMQLAAWVRQRFPREASGKLAALATPQADQGTAAAPGTVAGPTTPPNARTAAAPARLIAASRVAQDGAEPSGPGDSGTQILDTAALGDGIEGDTLRRPHPPVRPSAERTIAKPATLSSGGAPTIVDTPPGTQTMVDDAPRFAPPSGATVIDDRPRFGTGGTGIAAESRRGSDDGRDLRPAGSAAESRRGSDDRPRGPDAPTVFAKRGLLPAPSDDDDDDDLADSETIERPPTGLVPPSRPSPTATVGPLSGPRLALPPVPASQLAHRRSSRPIDQAQQRRMRVAIAASGLVGLALISFLIALAAKGTHAASPVGDAAAPRDALAAAHPDAAPLAVVPRDAAPTPAADADREAFLEVTTFPPGGTVRVGDQSRVAPAQLVVEAGTIGIEAQLEGYTPLHREETVEPGEHRSVELAFTRKLASPHGGGLGRLTARTSPYADVYENGKKLGETPFADRELSVGAHVLTFKNPLHPTVTKRVVITAGHTTKLSFDLP